MKGFIALIPRSIKTKIGIAENTLLLLDLSVAKKAHTPWPSLQALTIGFGPDVRKPVLAVAPRKTPWFLPLSLAQNEKGRLPLTWHFAYV